MWLPVKNHWCTSCIVTNKHDNDENKGQTLRHCHLLTELRNFDTHFRIWKSEAEPSVIKKKNFPLFFIMKKKKKKVGYWQCQIVRYTCILKINNLKNKQCSVWYVGEVNKNNTDITVLHSRVGSLPTKGSRVNRIEVRAEAMWSTAFISSFILYNWSNNN